MWLGKANNETKTEKERDSAVHELAEWHAAETAACSSDACLNNSIYAEAFASFAASTARFAASSRSTAVMMGRPDSCSTLRATSTLVPEGR